MIRRIFVVFLISLFFTVSAFADPASQNDFSGPNLLIPAFNNAAYIALAVPDDQIPEGIRNNEFLLESLRLTRLAQQTFECGDYDTSEGFAQEAIRYAALSDEFVSKQLLAEAKRLIDCADANNIAARFSDAYNEGKAYYEASVAAHSGEKWEESITASTSAIGILSALETNRSLPLPRQYTVRTWANERDCLWVIAGYSWVYGDPWKWRELYNANRSRLPDPNNPDLIEPGFVLEIPSIQGEVREGMWNPNATYRR